MANMSRWAGIRPALSYSYSGLLRVQVWGSHGMSDLELQKSPWWPRPSREQVGYFKQGVGTGLPIAFGYFPSAVAFGVVALAAGLTWRQALLMSVFVFSGAGQFMSVNLWGNGAALVAIIVANAVINLRYVVMSASLSRRLRLNRWQAAIVGFGVTDETFVTNYLANFHQVAQGETLEGGGGHRDILPSGFVMGVNVVSYLGWVAGTGTGIAFAGVLSERMVSGMGIVLYAMFIALLVPSIAKAWKIGVVAAVGGIFCWLFGQVLSFGWSMVLATTFTAALGVWLWGEEVDEL